MIVTNVIRREGVMCNCLTNVGYDFMSAVMRDMASTNLAMQERLERISVPLQVLWGKDDQVSKSKNKFICLLF